MILIEHFLPLLLNFLLTLSYAILLSLNASIEAARAGEAGKGFAVVSDSVLDISNNVNSFIGIQINAVEYSIESFSQIIDAINIMIPKINSINGMVLELYSKKNEILDKVGELPAIGEETSATYQEIAASSQEMNLNLNNIAETVNGLNNMVIDMMKLVDKFKIKSDKKFNLSRLLSIRIDKQSSVRYFMSIIKKFIIYLFIIGFATLIYSFIEPYWLHTKEVTISNRNIADSFNDVRIVFVSDIHHGPYFSRNRVKNLVKRINTLNPDIILLGGDYVSREPKYIEPFFEELKNLKATIGKYGVLGNHDHWESAKLTRECMKNSGIEIMDNTATWIRKGDDKIKIGGVGDIFENKQDINPTISDVKEDDFVMLLSHNPDYVEQIQTRKIDLVLSGHTHGGQVTFFGLWAPLIPSKYGQKYRTGIVETDFTKVLITNGVGTITPPARFFARPEIVLIYLNSGDASISGIMSDKRVLSGI